MKVFFFVFSILAFSLVVEAQEKKLRPQWSSIEVTWATTTMGDESLPTSTIALRSHDGASLTGVSITSITDPNDENIDTYSLDLGATVFERGKNSVNLLGSFGLRSHRENNAYGAQYSLAIELERYVARPVMVKVGLKLGDLGAPVNDGRSNYQQVYGGLAVEF